MLKTAIFTILALWELQALAAPADKDLSFVATSSEAPSDKNNKESLPTKPEIYLMHVQSNINNRFAHTTIISKVRNVAHKSQEAAFSVVLPETAFISGFIMEVDGKNYTAYVKEKEEAKRVYDQAVSSGLGAAHVAVSARDSNRFTVSVNVEPETKAAFYLTYEQLLKREDGYYEQVINLHPGQPVKDLSVECVISESRKIVDLKTPPLRSGNEISDENAELDPKSQVELINDTSAIVRFNPDIERQKHFGHLLGSEDDKGLSGQFVVRYDVERDPKGGEVLIQDGYFVHFFAPSDLPVLPKHVVFVLDTSSSMYDDKIRQLKEAMHKILTELHDADLFSLVEFNSNVKVWDLDKPENSVWYPTSQGYYGPYNDPGNADKGLEDTKFPPATSVNADNIKKAKETITAMTPTGATDIHTALKVGLHLVEITKMQNPDSNRQPMIVFLTDGDPTVRLTSTSEITNKITEYNIGLRKSPIFALSFGAGADKNFLQKIALRNSGFSKHIYEAADASLQLQDFYKQISSPLLADVTFKYEPSVESLTITEFPIYFKGSEIVIAGWCGTEDFKPPVIDAIGANQKIHLEPSITRSVSSMERLWAYLTIKQLLDKKETSDKDQEELKKKTVDLALKYSFVTPVSSLVVVKPNATNAVDAEDASKPTRGSPYGQYGPPAPSAYPQHSYASVPLVANNAGIAGRPYYAMSAVSFGDSGQRIGFGGVPAVSRFPAQAAPGIPGPPAAQPFYPQYITSTIPPRTYPTTVTTSTTKKPDIFNILPWLKDILKDNGVVSTPSGDYKLGLNETITDVVVCPKTPLDDAAGHCSLLHSCPQVHAKLISADVFNQYICVLKNEYAGVCCPNP